MIAIHEPLYAPGQQLQDAAFLPLHIENSRPAWRELAIIVDMYRKGIHRNAALTGLFSPRFRQKSGMSGADVIRHIEANPGGDVYLINSAAHLPYLSYNVWTDGECHHPGLMACAQAVLDASGIGWTISATPRQGPDRACYSNFWVGTEKFWDAYVGGVLIPIVEFLERHPDSPAARLALAPTSHYAPTPLLPFIGERLVSTYLCHSDAKVVPYIRDPLEKCRTGFDRDIMLFMGERVRRADREGHFPPDLIAWMNLICRLRARFRHAYYAHHPHPFSGETVDPALAEIGIRGLDAMPIAPLPAQ